MPRSSEDLPGRRVGIGRSGARACGNGLTLRLSVDAASNVIVDVAAEAFGGVGRLEVATVVARLVVGKTVEEALAIRQRDLAENLTVQFDRRQHCSTLVCEALRNAVAHYRGALEGVEREDGPVTCRCYAVREGMIRRAVQMNGLSSLDDVAAYTCAASSCGACAASVRAIIEETTQHAR